MVEHLGGRLKTWALNDRKNKDLRMATPFVRGCVEGWRVSAGTGLKAKQ